VGCQWADRGRYAAPRREIAASSIAARSSRAASGTPVVARRERVVLPGQFRVGVQRVTPSVQGVDPQPVPGDPVLPGRPGLIAGQQGLHVAVRMGRVAARTDLQVGHVRRVLAQPRHDLIQRPVQEGFQHHPDPQAAIGGH